MPKISRVRTGCWTCKRRHRKCDETKPTCKNCDTTGRACEGYNVRYSFDTDEKKTRRGRTAYSAGSSSSNGSDTSNPGFSVTTFSTNPNQSRPKLSPESLRQNANGIFETPFKSESESLYQESFPLKKKNDLEPFRSKENLQDPDESVDLETFVKSNETSKKSTWLHENEDLLFSQIFGDSIPLPYPEVAGSPTSPHPGKIFDRDVDTFMSRAPKLSLKLSFQEENKLLKHFFKSLLPLLDAHPHSPWPNLALRYCDFNLARSCFISLACIHLYSKEGGHDYYKQGIAHINSTMQYLITYISNNEALEQTREQRYSQSFIILVLVNVHILFAVLDKGQSSLSRYLFEVFGSICSDKDFCQSLLNHESKGALIVVLSWYDTVSAVVSPDCRLPFCKPELYGSSFNAISTTQMMGCPGEIFRAMYEVCYLRHRALKGELEDNMEFNLKVQSIKDVLFGYRDYIDFNDSADYNLQLKGASCWSLAVYVTVLRIFKTKVRRMLIKASVHEFIDVYGSMPSDSPLVTQMVWPLYAMACECTTEHEKDSFRVYMNKLNENGPMGTLSSLRWIVKEVWRRNTTQEAVLESWLEEGVDYHPL